MSPSRNHHRVFVAIDTQDIAEAVKLARALLNTVGGLKLGKEFFTAHGPDGVRTVAKGQQLLLDLKFHDIPNTVAGAVRAAVRLRPFMLTIHALGGLAMIEAAVRAAREAAESLEASKPLLLGVTVLTSLDEQDLEATGQRGPVPQQVLRLAELAQAGGCDGVICSPQEVATLRDAMGPEFLLVVPGVRPTWAKGQDQKRVMGPAEAMAAGADYLVVGRPITQAADRLAAAKRIAAELSG